MSKITLLVLSLLLVTVWADAQDPFSAQGAEWISAVTPLQPAKCPLFSKRLWLASRPQSATLWVTAQGIYTATINDHKVGSAYFAPGFTSYTHRLLYQRYDVSKLLDEGANELQVTLSGGWYYGVFGGDMRAGRYGAAPALLAFLQINYADGHQERIVTDTSWRVGEGPIRSSSLYGGECIDHRVVVGDWQPVKPGPLPKGKLEPAEAEPVEAQEVFNPRKLTDLPAGGTLIDFGQNLAGWVRLRVKGRPGDTVTVEHAEVLDKTGGFYTGNLREAKATDVYVLKGEGWESFEPTFTFHGFRYARIRGVSHGQFQATAIAVHNALRHTGSFQCSNPLLNQLQHNIEWSLNSNFVSIPTDCPQRSERLGWTGDAQVFAPTACFNRDVHRFFSSWLRDLAAGQGTNGGVPSIIPDIYRISDTTKGGAAGWGDAATIIPWTLFEVYNDTALLRRQYPSMKNWVEYIRSKAPDGLWKVGGYGDWYAQGDSTSLPFIDQCFFARSAYLLRQTAGVLGFNEDKRRYQALYDTVTQLFRQTYGGFDSKATQTQTAYALALAFDLLPDAERPAIATCLATAIQANNDHLATGFLGTPFLLPVLSRFGYDTLAYRLLLQTTCPSWLYPITRGATTIWEKWNAIRPDSSVQATSFNHYAYGAVGDWLYRYVAGITPLAPGYHRVQIARHPGGGLRWVNASYQSAAGKIVVQWKMRRHHLVLRVQIPADMTAVIVLPGQPSREVGPGSTKIFLPG